MKKDTSVKKPQPTIAKEKPPIQGKQKIEFYLDMYTMRQIPYSNQTLEDMAIELVQWAKNTPNAVSLYEFLTLKGINTSSFYRFMDRCPKLKTAKDFTLMILGLRREKGALFKDFDYHTMKHMQGFYDPQWKEREEYLNNLRTQANTGTTKIIVMDKIEAEDTEDNDGTKCRTTYFNE